MEKKRCWAVKTGIASLLLVLVLVPVSLLGAPPAYEVWVADQNANALHILDPDGQVLGLVDLARAARADRPHVLAVSPDQELVFSANTLSNSVSVHRAAARGAAVAVVENVGKSPHAAQPKPSDPDRVYVCNIGPRGVDPQGTPDRGETITEVVRTAAGWEIARRLDLAAEPALADPARFPSRRPVLAGFSADGRHMLVSLFHGGAASVDLDAWRVTAAWGREVIRGHATVVVPSPDGRELYVTAGDADSSGLHVFGAAAEPELLVSHDLSTWGRDAHGASVDALRKELWVVHRATSNATVHPLADLRSKGHEPAVVGFVGRTPDLIEVSPDGRRAYVTLRGPRPAPTIPFPLVGETPGLAIVDVPGRTLLRVVKLGDPVHGDFHGLAIVRRPP